ncbi:NlpC/P60 family protein [Streptomyces sp. NPDC056534]|uniref:NlpC/P60 family protein n=1 Tax=Streptomyces sp. NPDC056534 TaxID=3345857 RepID=UPI003674EA24
MHDGHMVPIGGVQPGDLLFSRGTAAAPEHVSMAIGYGYVVHAPRTGRVVEVAKQASMEQILVVRRIVG